MRLGPTGNGHSVGKDRVRLSRPRAQAYERVPLTKRHRAYVRRMSNLESRPFTAGGSAYVSPQLEGVNAFGGLWYALSSAGDQVTTPDTGQWLRPLEGAILGQR